MSEMRKLYQRTHQRLSVSDNAPFQYCHCAQQVSKINNIIKQPCASLFFYISCALWCPKWCCLPWSSSCWHFVHYPRKSEVKTGDDIRSAQPDHLKRTQQHKIQHEQVYFASFLRLAESDYFLKFFSSVLNLYITRQLIRLSLVSARTLRSWNPMNIIILRLVWKGKQTPQLFFYIQDNKAFINRRIFFFFPLQLLP